MTININKVQAGMVNETNTTDASVPYATEMTVSDFGFS